MERIPVLIGSKGSEKEEIESATETSINIDSKEGDVTIRGSDGLKLHTAREIIKAIGRGFNPKVALELLKPDFLFELIYLKDFAKTKNEEVRRKGRVIGKKGKSRNVIEELTDTNIVIFGKTIGIIGRVEDVQLASRAVQSLLAGSVHKNVYKWLEDQKRKRKFKSIGLTASDLKPSKE